MKRRQFINRAAATAATMVSLPLHAANNNKELTTTIDASIKTPLKNNIRHGVCHWCYSDIPLEEF